MKEILHRMLNHEELTRQETHDILVGITKSEFPMEQVTALLTALQMRGITVDELLGLRDGILETGVPARLECDRYIEQILHFMINTVQVRAIPQRIFRASCRKNIVIFKKFQVMFRSFADKKIGQICVDREKGERKGSFFR